MRLTDNAKQDFLIWYGTGENYFNVTLQPIEQYANIIDWLDSVGIYITIEGSFDRMLGYHRGFEVYVYQDGKTPVSLIEDNDVFENRQAATEAAIKLANKIYNNEKRN